MPPPSRTYRILKWTGVGLSLLMAVIWVRSLIGVSLSPRWSGNTIVFIESGVVVISRAEFSLDAAAYEGVNMTLHYSPSNLGLVSPRTGKSNWASTGPAWSVAVPLWRPFLLTALPTTWLFHRDRRRIPPGCCPRCGYNLTGNTSGVCSECGETIAASPPSSSR